MGKDFLLLKSGPGEPCHLLWPGKSTSLGTPACGVAGPQEEPTAGGDLLKYHQINKGFYDAATHLAPGNYLKSLPGSVAWYR